MRIGSRTPALVERVVIGVRGEDGYTEIEAEAAEGGGYVALLPRVPALRYYVRFVAPSGYVVAEAGSPDVPLTWTDPGAQTEATALRRNGPTIPTPAGGEDYTGLGVGLGVGAALVVAAVIALVLWQPWNQGATLSRGLELP